MLALHWRRGGPVLATTLMVAYTAPLSVLPSVTAFNVIFEVGIALAIVAGLISLATRNYKFKL